MFGDINRSVSYNNGRYQPVGSTPGHHDNIFALQTSGCGDESQDTSQMSQSVLKEGKIGESDVPTSSSPITKTGLEGQAENSQSDDQTSLIKEKEKESIEEGTNL